MFDFRKEFTASVARNKVDFAVRGVLGADDRLFPLGTDTKVLSTVFELICRPLVREIAEGQGYAVEESRQTIYPDFTLLRNAGDTAKMAVDIKTTYRRPDIVFTLGSYTSFLRNNTKNILYPYNQYGAHWIIGFVYDRTEAVSNEIIPLKDRAKAVVPYKNVEWFVQEKYRIAGTSPGSGNTTNIGSIKRRDLTDYAQGNGPFAKLGEAVFRDYWAHFGDKIDGLTYKNLEAYLEWKKRATGR